MTTTNTESRAARNARWDAELERDIAEHISPGIARAFEEGRRAARAGRALTCPPELAEFHGAWTAGVRSAQR